MFKPAKKVALDGNVVITTDFDSGDEIDREEYATPEEAASAIHKIFTDVNEDPMLRIENEPDGMVIFEMR